MFINVDPDRAYWFQAEQIRVLEKRYRARYMGFWCVRTRDGNWSDYPVEVFFQSRPDVSKAHGQYIGVFLHENKPVVIDAESAFSEPMTGVLLKSGEVLVSRFRHDYQCRDGVSVDGGRDYSKVSARATQVDVQVSQGEFLFNEPVYA